MLLKLAKPGALAGQVIKHSTQVLENMLDTHGPMVYKIGFSFDPHNRFSTKASAMLMNANNGSEW